MSTHSDPRDDSLRQANELDRLCDEFEASWLRGAEPVIADYLERANDAIRPELFRELLALDKEYRRRFQVDHEMVAESIDDPAATVQYQDDMFGQTEMPDDDPTQIIDPQVQKKLVANAAEAASAEHSPEQFFGDYELLEQIGRGGMGVVYRARQRSANRDVALKVIRPDRLGTIAEEHQGTAIERFQTEAKAAAQLMHEGIVTVYEVGEKDGQHFFSMQYVDGRSLSDILREGPLENKTAARYLAQTARALHEAHLQGVLHRDLKPQNILIETKSDQALVADFGLAKLLEGSDELTRYGEVMGTPQYMSPEQAQDAASVDPSTDIYALGATLYHLLTGRPPFHAATVFDTLQQVIHEEPVPPRQLNPAIDRDLETICLKCLEKDSSRRYGSALLLAEELDRYLAGIPIQARRITPLEKGWRWCRRNPAIAVLANLALLFLCVALVATTVGYLRVSKAQQASEEGFQSARQALDSVFLRIRQEPLLKTDQMSPLREDLLRQALMYYQGFLQKRANDPTITEEVAATYYRIGLIYNEIDTADKAIQAYSESERLQATLSEVAPNDVDLLLDLSTTRNALARALYRQEEREAAIEKFAAATADREEIVRLSRIDDPRYREFQRKLLNSYMNLGIVEKNRGQADLARSFYEKAQALRFELLERNPDDFDIRLDTGIGHYNLGQLALDSETPEDAVRDFTQAIEQFDQLVAAGQADKDTRYYRALCLRLLADLDQDYEAAGVRYRQALAELTSLAAQNPDVNDFQIELAQIYMNLGQLDYDAEQTVSALKSLEQAAEIFGELIGEDDSIPDYRRNLGIAYQAIGELHLAEQRGEEARQTLERSEQLLRNLALETKAERDIALLQQTRDLLREAEKPR